MYKKQALRVVFGLCGPEARMVLVTPEGSLPGSLEEIALGYVRSGVGGNGFERTHSFTDVLSGSPCAADICLGMREAGVHGGAPIGDDRKRES